MDETDSKYPVEIGEEAGQKYPTQESQSRDSGIAESGKRKCLSGPLVPPKVRKQYIAKLKKNRDQCPHCNGTRLEEIHGEGDMSIPFIKCTECSCTWKLICTESGLSDFLMSCVAIVLSLGLMFLSFTIIETYHLPKPSGRGLSLLVVSVGVVFTIILWTVLEMLLERIFPKGFHLAIIKIGESKCNNIGTSLPQDKQASPLNNIDKIDQIQFVEKHEEIVVSDGLPEDARLKVSGMVDGEKLCNPDEASLPENIKIVYAARLQANPNACPNCTGINIRHIRKRIDLYGYIVNEENESDISRINGKMNNNGSKKIGNFMRDDLGDDMFMLLLKCNFSVVLKIIFGIKSDKVKTRKQLFPKIKVSECCNCGCIWKPAELSMSPLSVIVYISMFALMIFGYIMVIIYMAYWYMDELMKELEIELYILGMILLIGLGILIKVFSKPDGARIIVIGKTQNNNDDKSDENKDDIRT